METTNNSQDTKERNFLHSWNIGLNIPMVDKRYGCVFIFQTGEDETSQNVLKYEVNILYCDDLQEKQRRLFKVERISETYINDYLPDLLVDELAYEAGKVFYPMLVETDYSGQFTAIHNCDEIIQRWSGVRKKVTNYFVGKEVEEYLTLMENTLYSREELNEVFRKDLFFSTYFAPVYKNYTNNFSIRSEILYPVIGKINPLAFSVEEKLCKELTDYDAIKIIHSGTMTDERTVIDLEQRENYPVHKMLYPNLKPAEGSYKAYYTLNPETKQIRTIDAKWELELSKKKTVEVKIHQIDSDYKDPNSFIIEEWECQISKRPIPICRIYLILRLIPVRSHNRSVHIKV